MSDYTNKNTPFWKRRTEWGYKNPAYDKFERRLAIISMIAIVCVVIVILFRLRAT